MKNDDNYKRNKSNKGKDSTKVNNNQQEKISYKQLIIGFSCILLIALLISRPFRFLIFEMVNFTLEIGLFISLIFLFVCIVKHPETLSFWYKFRKMVEGVSPHDRGHSTDVLYQNEIFYSKMSNKDLIQLCKDRNIDTNRLSKVQIVQKLASFDMNEHLKEHKEDSLDKDNK